MNKLIECMLALTLVCGWQMAVAGAETRPNILIILADDVGISDIGCYGGEIDTPNLDTLAQGGVRFREFYNTGRCCPTRASLLTGLYPHQAGIGHMMDDRGLPGYRGELSANCVTIAEVLRSAGYRNYMVGKWHVTKNVSNPEADAIGNWPLQRGFDACYATLSGAGNYFQPAGLIRGDAFVSSASDPRYAPSRGTYYYTDALSDNAVAFLREHAATHGEQPFFMYLAYTAAHWPLQALPQDIEKYRGRFDSGWDVLREERLVRMKRLGLVPESARLSPRAPGVPAWATLSPEERRWQASRMEVYAAMLDCMDQGIGRVVDQLKASGQFENTLIFYLQDNGGCAEEMGSDARQIVYARGQAASPDDRRAPMPPEQPSLVRHDVWTREGLPVRSGRMVPGPVDTFVAYGLPWANVSNTPFRLYKHFVHEGGISTPMIVSWPKSVPPRQWVDGPGHLIDLMATCVEAADAHYPQQRDGRDVLPMEGVSLLPLLRGGELERTTHLFFEHEGNRAVRAGKWKLVARGWNGPWQLYDLENDREELRNLAGEMPQMVERLAGDWSRWAVRAQVLPSF